MLDAECTLSEYMALYIIIGQLRPREGEAPSFAQIITHDGTTECELESRLTHLGEAFLPELRGLQVMLHEVKPSLNKE